MSACQRQHFDFFLLFSFLSCIRLGDAPPGAKIITKQALLDRPCIIEHVQKVASSGVAKAKALRMVILAEFFDGDFGAVFTSEAENLIAYKARDAMRLFTQSRDDSKRFVQRIMEGQAEGGYAAYDLNDDFTLRRAFWATVDQANSARQYGLDVVLQVRFAAHSVAVVAAEPLCGAAAAGAV
jgi:hypothetical protein